MAEEWLVTEQTTEISGYVVDSGKKGTL